MHHYISEEGSPESISLDIGREFGPIDVVRVLNEFRTSQTPQIYGIQKGGGSICSAVMVKDGVAYFGCCDGNFYAVDAETGREVWRFAAGGPVVGGGTPYGDKVYFGCWDCHVYCLDRAKGRLVWRFQTSSSSMSGYEPDIRSEEPEVSIAVRIPEPEEVRKREEEGTGISDYGEFSGGYMDTSKADYLGIRKKGYVSKKKGD
jgi:hypothetical protein